MTDTILLEYETGKKRTLRIHMSVVSPGDTLIEPSSEMTEAIERALSGVSVPGGASGAKTSAAHHRKKGPAHMRR